MPNCKQFARVSKRFLVFFIYSFGNHVRFIVIPLVKSFLLVVAIQGIWITDRVSFSGQDGVKRSLVGVRFEWNGSEPSNRLLLGISDLGSNRWSRFKEGIIRDLAGGAQLSFPSW